MNAYLNLADNPLFVKHIRSRLRRGALMPSVVIVAFFSLCIVWLDFAVFKDDNPGLGSHFFFWMQVVILLLIGGSQVATSVGYVKESGILDFHRITPVPSSVQALGFLLGAPIREWILFACTLPFALICAVNGPWGLTGFTKVLLVQITGALLYHSIGIVAGLAGKTAKGASGRLVGAIVALNVLATNFSQEGIYGPTLLSPLPVYRDVAFGDPQPWRAAMRQQAMRQQPVPPNAKGFQPGAVQPVRAMPAKPDPRFFAVPVPLVAQTLLFQSLIFVFLMIASSRRFRSARMPLYSKPQALAFLAVLAFLTLGSMWETSTMGLVLSSSYFLTLAAVWLVTTVTPAVGDISKGLQRARRHGTSVSVWSDLASNTVAVACFAGLLLGALALAVVAGPKANAGNIQFEPWPPPCVVVLTILSYGWALQYFHLRYARLGGTYFALYLFGIWVVPLVLGGLLAASGAKEALALMAASPIAGIAMSGITNIPHLDPSLVTVLAIAPLAVCTLLFAVLVRKEEHRIGERVRKEHEVRGAETLEPV
jgi:hypothetical protein